VISGYFATGARARRPFVNAVLDLPAVGRRLSVPLLVDTGADRTVLAPLDARRWRVDLTALPAGAPSSGIGGRVTTRTVDAILTLQDFSTSLSLTILEWPPPPAPTPAIHSVLGRDVISRFALFVEERTSRVLLLEPAEADAFALP
jgi:hypothetical protein